MSVFGVYGVQNAAQVIYFGLHALQHRGQEGAGVAVFDDAGICHNHRGLGLAGEVFAQGKVLGMPGILGIAGCAPVATKTSSASIESTFVSSIRELKNILTFSRP